MIRRTIQADALPPTDLPRRDRGTTFIEILIAIVLLGTVVVAALAGVRATIIGTEVDRDHANAHAWLQSASDVLYGVPRVDCGSQSVSNKANVLASYRAVVQGTANPEGWPSTNIEVIDVEFWDGDEYQTTCYDDFGINLQLIELRVRDTERPNCRGVTGGQGCLGTSQTVDRPHRGRHRRGPAGTGDECARRRRCHRRPYCTHHRVSTR